MRNQERVCGCCSCGGSPARGVFTRAEANAVCEGESAGRAPHTAIISLGEASKGSRSPSSSSSSSAPPSTRRIHAAGSASTAKGPPPPVPQPRLGSTSPARQAGPTVSRVARAWKGDARLPSPAAADAVAAAARRPTARGRSRAKASAKTWERSNKGQSSRAKGGGLLRPVHYTQRRVGDCHAPAAIASPPWRS